MSYSHWAFFREPVNLGLLLKARVKVPDQSPSPKSKSERRIWTLGCLQNLKGHPPPPTTFKHDMMEATNKTSPVTRLKKGEIQV